MTAASIAVARLACVAIAVRMTAVDIVTTLVAQFASIIRAQTTFGSPAVMTLIDSFQIKARAMNNITTIADPRNSITILMVLRRSRKGLLLRLGRSYPGS
ncbi:hypothetical protein EDB80DRAFT_740151 [Ilyonectria destructans]|nr:hypothetical protein EDB80DRAFT_740151 [Ilyonectria destructans]